MNIRVMTIEDFDQVHALWMSIKGFGIRSVDDSKEGVERFLKRNPTTSVVAEEDGKIVGAILCGHDGRRGCLYHVCVDVNHRMKGIGKAMVVFTMEALKKEGINKVSLIAFTQNDIGNAFWKEIGWTKREDLNYYDFTLNENNDLYEWGLATEQTYMKNQFQKISAFANGLNMPVIIGEYGAIDKDNIEERSLYLRKLNEYAAEYNIVTAYWDNGFIGEYGFAIFNRNTNTVYPTSQSLINAIMGK